MPFSLILCPDSPSMDKPCGGTLRFLGHWILTNVCITQANILASASSTPARTSASLWGGTLPYWCIFTSHSFSRLLSLIHICRKSAQSVSYYSLFQGWLLLGKPPGCLCTRTSFITEQSFRGLSWWSGLFPSQRWSLSPSSHWLTFTPFIGEI